MIEKLGEADLDRSVLFGFIDGCDGGSPFFVFPHVIPAKAGIRGWMDPGLRRDDKFGGANQ